MRVAHAGRHGLGGGHEVRLVEHDLAAVAVKIPGMALNSFAAVWLDVGDHALHRLAGGRVDGLVGRRGSLEVFDDHGGSCTAGSLGWVECHARTPSVVRAKFDLAWCQIRHRLIPLCSLSEVQAPGCAGRQARTESGWPRPAMPALC